LATPDSVHVVQDNEKLRLSNDLTAIAVFTPGHSPACISWQVGDVLFTGDSYIPGIKTVTNVPHADKVLAAQSEKLIRDMAQTCTIYPGHFISQTR